MTFIIDNPDRDVTEKISEVYEKYRQYLESVRDRLPREAYEFAIADWHYDHHDHKCPHDCWLESFTIEEPSEGERHENRWNNIRTRYLGAYHDGHIEITYLNVHSYTLKKGTIKYPNGHGDWLDDEIRLSESGNVIHEITFAFNARWLIECENIIYEWKPMEGKRKSPSL